LSFDRAYSGSRCVAGPDPAYPAPAGLAALDPAYFVHAVLAALGQWFARVSPATDRAAEIDPAYPGPARHVARGQRGLGRGSLLPSRAPTARRSARRRRICRPACLGLTLWQLLPITQPC